MENTITKSQIRKLRPDLLIRRQEDHRYGWKNFRNMITHHFVNSNPLTLSICKLRDLLFVNRSINKRKFKLQRDDIWLRKTDTLKMLPGPPIFT